MSTAERLPQESVPPKVNTTPIRDRKIGFLLGCGILFIPQIFSWFTLRKGYSNSTRVISLFWMFIVLTITFGRHSAHEANNAGGVSNGTSVEKSVEKKAPINMDALKGLRKTVDKMEGVQWFNAPGYESDIGNGTKILIYMGLKSERPFLRLFNNYAADDWLFIHEYKFLIDGEHLEMSPRMETKVTNGIREWSDVSVGPEEMILIQKIIASKSAVIRYGGRQFYKDRTITKGEKKAMAKVFDAYEAIH